MKRRNIVPRAPAKEGETIRLLKRVSFPSLTGKSTLAGEIGFAEDRKVVVLHVVGNAGGGTWNGDWQELRAVQAALDRAPKGQAVTADVLTPLFRGTSQNSAYFFLALLKHLGLVAPSTSKPRCYDRVDASGVMDELRALIDGKATADVKRPKGKVKTPAPSEVSSASTKKKKAAA